MKKIKFLFDFLLFELEKWFFQLANFIHGYRVRQRPSLEDFQGKDIKLDLGCGGAKRKGYIGIDVTLGPAVDIQYDLTTGIPFKSKTVSAIYASHFLEHLSHKQALFLIKECARVLKQNGTIEIEVPDLDAVLRSFLAMDDDSRWESGWDWIFGNQRTDYEYHRTGFSKNRLNKLLHDSGFEKLVFSFYKDGEIPSIRVIAKKR